MTNTALEVTSNTDALPSHTLLGQRTLPLKTAGKIRPGIKVLSAAAEKNEHARAIYEAGLKRGDSFESIAQAITKAVPDLKNPLAMRNTPYFTVRRGDMVNPGIADQIIALYGEDRGDGVRRLYRFPVVFPFDQWQLIVPHNLYAYTAGGLKYWSEFAPDGRTRYCMTYATPPTNGDGRVIRIFGGRKIVRREENGGLCEPERCAEFQARKCNMTGRIIFWIPGVQTLLPLEIPTGSYYALSGIIGLLQRVAYSRGGRLTGFLGRDKTTFWIGKSFESVPRYDAESNRLVRVDQWIIRLDAPVDVASLLGAPDDEVLVADGQGAAALLTVDQTAGGNGEHRHSAGDGSKMGAPKPIDAEPKRAEAGGSVPRAAQSPASPLAGAGATIEAGMAELAALLSELGVEQPKFERYAAKRWGAGWCKNPKGIAKAAQVVAAHRDDVPGLLFKMEQELDVFA